MRLNQDEITLIENTKPSEWYFVRLATGLTTRIWNAFASIDASHTNGKVNFTSGSYQELDVLLKIDDAQIATVQSFSQLCNYLTSSMNHGSNYERFVDEIDFNGSSSDYNDRKNALSLFMTGKRGIIVNFSGNKRFILLDSNITPDFIIEKVLNKLKSASASITVNPDSTITTRVKAFLSVDASVFSEVGYDYFDVPTTVITLGGPILSPINFRGDNNEWIKINDLEFRMGGFNSTTFAEKLQNYLASNPTTIGSNAISEGSLLSNIFPTTSAKVPILDYGSTPTAFVEWLENFRIKPSIGSFSPPFLPLNNLQNAFQFVKDVLDFHDGIELANANFFNYDKSNISPVKIDKISFKDGTTLWYASESNRATYVLFGLIKFLHNIFRPDLTPISAFPSPTSAEIGINNSTSYSSGTLVTSTVSTISYSDFIAMEITQEDKMNIYDHNAVTNAIYANPSDFKIQSTFSQSETVYLKTTDGQITPIVDDVYPLSRLLEETPDLTAKTVFETAYADLERDIESYYFQLDSVKFKASDTSMIFASNSRTASIQQLLDPKLPNMILTHVQDVTYPMSNGFNINMRMWETEATVEQFLGSQDDYTTYQYSSSQVIETINGLTRESFMAFVEDWTQALNPDRPDHIQSVLRMSDGKEAKFWNGFEAVDSLVTYFSGKADPQIFENPERKKIAVYTTHASTDSNFTLLSYVRFATSFATVSFIGETSTMNALRAKVQSLFEEVDVVPALNSYAQNLLFELDGLMYYAQMMTYDISEYSITLEDFTQSSNGGGLITGDTYMRNPEILAQMTIGDIHYLHLKSNPVTLLGGLKAPIGSRAVYITPEKVALCFLKEGEADNSWVAEPVGDFADRHLGNLLDCSLNVDLMPDQDFSRSIGSPAPDGKRFLQVCANYKLLVGELHINNESDNNYERQTITTRGEIQNKSAELIISTSAPDGKDQHLHLQTDRLTEVVKSSYKHIKGTLGNVLEMTSWDGRSTYKSDVQTDEMLVDGNVDGFVAGPFIYSHPQSLMKLKLSTTVIDMTTKKVAVLDRMIAVKTDVDGNVNNIISVHDVFTAKEAGLEQVDVDFQIALFDGSGKQWVQPLYVANDVGGNQLKYITTAEILCVKLDQGGEL